MSVRPLDGLRVLDLSRALSGPFAGRILADLGADVVKVELPGADIAQTYGKMVRGRSGLYSQLNARSSRRHLRHPATFRRVRLVEAWNFYSYGQGQSTAERVLTQACQGGVALSHR